MNTLLIFVNKKNTKMKLSYENHREKCRICLSKFEGGLKKIQITQQIQKGFFDISGIEVCLVNFFK